MASRAGATSVPNSYNAQGYTSQQSYPTSQSQVASQSYGQQPVKPAQPAQPAGGYGQQNYQQQGYQQQVRISFSLLLLNLDSAFTRWDS